jgi:hypothetical protein
VSPQLSATYALLLSIILTTPSQIDVDDKGSLDKATVIAAVQQTGDADYDTVSPNE